MFISVYVSPFLFKMLALPTACHISNNLFQRNCRFEKCCSNRISVYWRIYVYTRDSSVNLLPRAQEAGGLYTPVADKPPRDSTKQMLSVPLMCLNIFMQTLVPQLTSLSRCS